jgi:hypothetical protein
VTAERNLGPLSRIAGALLLGLMALGVVALCVGAPAATLWGLGKLVDTPAEHLTLALMAVPLAMALCGMGLVRLNAAYIRVHGSAGPLDWALAMCAVLAVLGLLAWMTFADTTGPVAPW